MTRRGRGPVVPPPAGRWQFPIVHTRGGELRIDECRRRAADTGLLGSLPITTTYAL